MLLAVFCPSIFNACANPTVPVVFSVKVYGASLSDRAIAGNPKFFADGREISEVGAGSDSDTSFDSDFFSFEVAGQFGGRSPGVRIPQLTAKIFLPCGWRDLDLTVTAVPTPEEVQTSLKSESKPQVKAQLKYPHVRWIDFQIDNRGGGPTQLALGELTRQIKAGMPQQVTAVAPDCPSGASLRLNDREIGTVPWQSTTPNENLPRHFLIDTSGKRCYRLSGVNYVRENALPSVGSPYQRNPVLLSGKHLYVLEIDIKYFLEKAPPRVSVPFEQASVSSPSGGELLQVSCK